MWDLSLKSANLDNISNLLFLEAPLQVTVQNAMHLLYLIVHNINLTNNAQLKILVPTLMRLLKMSQPFDVDCFGLTMLHKVINYVYIRIILVKINTFRNA